MRVPPLRDKPRVWFGTYPSRLIRIREIKRGPPQLEVGELEGELRGENLKGKIRLK